VLALNHDYITSNSLTLDAGGLMVLANDTLTASSGVTIQNGGLLQGNNATVTNAIVNNSSVQVGAGNLILLGAVSGSGVLSYDPAGQGTIEVAGATGNAVSMAGGTTLRLDAPASFTGTVSATPTSSIILQGITADSATLSGSTLSVMNGSVPVYALNLAGDYTGDTFSVSMVNGAADISVVCFARGTRIRTPDGYVPVESLEVGQMVLTASGKPQPIVWLGRRRVDCRRHPQPWRVWPIRISAGAFGPSLPKRDLLVSPQHAIFDEGVLVPARFLINDDTVQQEAVAQVEYFHIELPSHDLLLAEGLRAESYLDTGDRNTFENGGGALVLHPDFSRWTWDARACAELKVVGPELDTIRAKLARRAARQRKARVASVKDRGTTARRTGSRKTG